MANTNFNIYGPGITNMILDTYYGPKSNPKNAKDICASCMMDETGTISEKQKNRLIEDVLLGRAKFTGDTKNDSFCLTVYGADDEDAPEIPDYQNIFKLFEEAKKTIDKLRKDYKRMCEWYAIALSRIEREDNRQIVFTLTNQIEEPNQLNDIYPYQLVNDVIEYSKDTKEHSTDDYGFLEPNGTFHEVPWGDHESWAHNYVKYHLEKKEWQLADNHKNHYLGAGYSAFGDYLLDKGWILLHSPYNTTAKAMKAPQTRITKAQKEFLFDYYMERNKEELAYNLYKDDNY